MTENAAILTRLLTEDSTNAVALLVLNEREDEAKKLAETFRAEWDNQDFHVALGEALKGHLTRERNRP